jgi:DNA-binding response OmpR family regulator
VPGASPSRTRQLTEPLQTHDRAAATILVCDDEPPLRELVRAILGDRFAYVEVSDGESALAQTRDVRPDLVILDVMLPRRNGLEVLTEIRRSPELADIPVVVVTAWTHAESSALAAGANRVLGKPFDPDELTAAVEELLEVA